MFQARRTYGTFGVGGDQGGARCEEGARRREEAGRNKKKIIGKWFGWRKRETYIVELSLGI